MALLKTTSLEIGEKWKEARMGRGLWGSRRTLLSRFVEGTKLGTVSRERPRHRH